MHLHYWILRTKCRAPIGYPLLLTSLSQSNKKGLILCTGLQENVDDFFWLEKIVSWHNNLALGLS